VRNEWQKQNVSDISKFFLFFFDANNVRAATNLFKKVTVKGDESNNSGVSGVEPQAAGGQLGFGGGASNAATIFQFFSKNNAFLCIFWSKFLLKNVF